MSRPGFFSAEKNPGAIFKISPSSDNIFCSNFQDRPGWIWNAQIRCLLTLPLLWGYFSPSFWPHAPKNLDIFWKIADLRSETIGFHDGSTRRNAFLQIRCVANRFLFNVISFAVLSIAIWVLKSEHFENFPFLVTQPGTLILRVQNRRSAQGFLNILSFRSQKKGWGVFNI